MYKQCNSCIHEEVCAHKQHYEEIYKKYDMVKDDKYPFFQCTINCIKYHKKQTTLVK